MTPTLISLYTPRKKRNSLSSLFFHSLFEETIEGNPEGGFRGLKETISPTNFHQILTIATSSRRFEGVVGPVVL